MNRIREWLANDNCSQNSRVMTLGQGPLQSRIAADACRHLGWSRSRRSLQHSQTRDPSTAPRTRSPAINRLAAAPTASWPRTARERLLSRAARECSARACVASAAVALLLCEQMQPCVLGLQADLLVVHRWRAGVFGVRVCEHRHNPCSRMSQTATSRVVAGRIVIRDRRV